MVPGQDLALHHVESAGQGDLHESLQHPLSNPVASQLLRNDQSELATGPIGVGDVSDHAVLNLASALIDRGDQCHLPVVIDLSEPHQHLGRQFVDRVHEAEVFGFVGEVPDEIRLNLGVLGSDGPDRHVGTVGQLEVRLQVRWVGMDRHVVVGVSRGTRHTDHDPCVDRYGTVLVDEQRVDVHLLEPGKLTRHVGDAQQDIDQGIDVDRWEVPEPLKQLGDLRAGDEVLGEALVERREGHSNILHHLNPGPSKTEADHGPEHRVVDDADHDFASIRRAAHLLDRDPLKGGLRSGFAHPLHEVVVGAAYVGRVLDAELDTADVGLVRDVLGVDLHRDRESH